MSDIQPLLVEDEDGTTYTIYVKSKTPTELPRDLPKPGEVDEGDRESYGFTDEASAKLQEIQGTIRAYALQVAKVSVKRSEGAL